MQCYKHKDETIASNQYVPFDYTIFDNSNGIITYNDEQRVFHLNELGVYKIDYQIAYNGTSVYDSACFKLVFNNTWQVTNCSSGTTGQVSANALLDCDSAGGVLYIIPFGQDINLGSVDFQANIVIVKLA